MLVKEDLPSVGSSSGDKYYTPNVCQDFGDYKGSVMSIDPAGRGKDELAIAIVKQLGGKFICARMHGVMVVHRKQSN